jgi:hypothetical protein
MLVIMTKPISSDFEGQPQPNKKVLKPIDTDRVPEYKPCRACNRRHGRIGDHIACLNVKIDELENELRPYRAVKAEIEEAKKLPRSPGGLVESRDIKKK